MREFLKGLELDKETIDTIMAEHGKLITESKEKISELEGKVKTYETTVKELETKSGDNQKVQEELDNLKKSITEKEEADKKAKEDKLLTDEIGKVFEGKSFVNDYTKNSIINDIKSELLKPENKGKGYKEIAEVLTKDKDGIFVNPNKAKDMDGMNQNISTDVTKETFEKMGYKERLTLKQENPDLYQSFIGSK